ncbi:uncharacterized protein LOC129411914 isoform X2 [Boleophthalmus pectinirostris]|nr:uncharacterized protein LOC129411914 isoform X2 [Boleophthalmus pectinirostris]
MALTSLKGNWHLFLLGLLLLISPVFGAVTTAASSAAASTTTAMPTSTVTATTTAMPTTTVTATTTAMPTTTVTATTTAMPTSTGGSPSVSPVSSSSGMNPSMSSASMGGNTGGWASGTTGWSNYSMSNISCPSFMCNYSDCYSMYMSQNATMCPAGYDYCELIRQMDICYTVSCSASCSMSCGNTSQSNCSVNCCNSTDCLNDTFASMMMTTTPAMTTTSRSTTISTTTTTTTAAPTTQGGNKCHTGKCNGTDCYTVFNTAQVCTASQPHCQLKKETVGTSLQWTAGCTTNCSGQTSCKASTQPPCHLECCNATVTSCLWLNGTLNVPSLATRGPQLHSQVVSAVLVVFAISLLL